MAAPNTQSSGEINSLAGNLTNNIILGNLTVDGIFTLDGIVINPSLIGNIANGAVNEIPVQTASSVTGFIPAPSIPSTVLTWTGSAFEWNASVGLGTVTSVGITDGSTTPIFTIANSPITSSGSITLTLNSETANTIFAGPVSGANAQPGFRSLVSADIPNNAANTSGNAANATSATSATTATNIAGGTALKIPFQTGAGVTSFIAAPTVSNTFLEYNGTSLVWSTVPGSGTVTTVSVVSANGFAGSVANSSTTPAITLSTSITGILKGDGTSISAAIASDFPTLNQSTTGNAATASACPYSGLTGTVTTWNQSTTGNAATATTSTNIGSGAANQVVYQSGVGTTGFITAPLTSDVFLRWNGSSFDWNSPGGSGSVTSVSVVTANGFAGSVANSSTTPAITLTTSVSGILKGNGTSVTNAVAGVDYGFANIPQNSQSTAYTLVLADAGKHIYHPASDTTARTYTIPANSSVAYPIGTAITFVNDIGSGQNITIAITSDTLNLVPAGTTGSRTLQAGGQATALKVTSTSWQIAGSGLT